MWGCITYFGQGTLTLVDGNLNSEKYIKLLDDNLWPVVAKYFLATNLLCSKMTMTHPMHLAKQNCGRKLMEFLLSWPSQSPDLNIIENVWLLMKNTVKKNMRDINTVHDLKRVLFRTWKSIPLMYIQNLYSSIPKGLRVVIRSKGHITKY